MDSEELYFDHEELMSPEEKEDGDYMPGSSLAPDHPSWYRNFMLSGIEFKADAEGRKRFEQRPPALGLNARMIDDIENYPNIPGVTASQVRRFTELIT